MNRKILTSVLVIGMIGALVSGSTLALFTDEETSEGNVFTAGSLDLKVDWNESYNGESVENQSLTDDPSAVFNLSDVKPGDWGEATLSMHVFDNPGYIWLRMVPRENSEPLCTEPEAKAEGGDCGTQGELYENLEFMLWYDDGDNVFEPEDGEQKIAIQGNRTTTGGDGDELDVSLVLDTSGSMEGDKIGDAKNGSKVLVDALGSNDQSGLVEFSSSADTVRNLTTNKTDVKNGIDSLTAGGGTDIPSGVREGTRMLINSSQARSGASKIMIFLSDGRDTRTPSLEAANNSKDQGVRIITIAVGDGADRELLRKMASSDSDFYNVSNSSQLTSVFGNISGTIGTTNNLEQGILLDADPDTPETDAFVNSTTRYIGFKWNLPLETGNEVQADTFKGDIEFYAEQERNNPDPENPWTN